MDSLQMIFQGWEGYNTSLQKAIEPLNSTQLSWRPSDTRRSVGKTAMHIAAGRINWFSRMHLPDQSMLSTLQLSWEVDPDGNRHCVVQDVMSTDSVVCCKWLSASWQMIEACLAAWTSDELSRTYKHRWRGELYEVTYPWTIWRILSHDQHHGGQIAMMLGLQGIEAFELRGLGGHIVEPKKL